ncbi:MAG: DUF456 family protein [Phycisphaerales bacterium]|jgi:hypothetical protein|nr:DUF456 family protein [Phycisphaerales bacterium]
MEWGPILAALVVVLSTLVGMGLAVLTLPGVWVMLLVAALVKWLWVADLISVWTLVAGVVLAVIGEVVEGALSAAGAAKFGSSRAGAVASIGGGLLGALIGTFVIPVPIVGTLVGAVAGAAAATFGVEAYYKKRPEAEAARAAGGAAIGRVAATVIKLGVAGIVAILLIAAVCVRGM